MGKVININEADIRQSILHEIKRRVLLREGADEQLLYKALSTFGNDTSSLGMSIAEYLYNNGLDCGDFVKWVESEYEQLSAESQEPEQQQLQEPENEELQPTKDGLVKAIQRASSYTGNDSKGIAGLRQAVYVKVFDVEGRMPINFIEYLYDDEGEPGFFGGMIGNGYYDNPLDLKQNEIEYIMGLLR